LNVLDTSKIEEKYNKEKTKIISYEYTVDSKKIPFKPEEIIKIINYNPRNSYPIEGK